MNYNCFPLHRFLDVLISLCLLPFATVIIFIVSIISLIVDREFPLFFQKRIGVNRRPFLMFKIRTMYSSTPNSLPSHLINSNTITLTGRFVRRFKLDELPQLFNVILGDMSLVGPRPCLPSQSIIIDIRFHNGLYSVRPGVTGYSQVNKIDMSSVTKLIKYDLCTISSLTTFEYLRIILHTFIGRGSFDPVTKETSL
jgi:O-antigen biosynthesis protein WbqP